MKEFERDSGVEIFRRLFILLPESCYLPSDLSKHEADEDSIQFVRNLKAVIVDRNGIKNRTYTNPVYRITTSTGDVRIIMITGFMRMFFLYVHTMASCLF